MFVALRDIRFAKGRFALMGAVVTLITTLVVFLYGLTGGLARAASSAIAELPADSVVFGALPGAEPEVSFSNSTVSAGQESAWAHAPGVRGAEPFGTAMTRMTAGSRAESVSVIGSGAALLPPVSEGIAPRDGQAAVSSGLAKEHGLRPGDRITLGTEELTVSAVTADRSFGHAGTVWTSLPTWQRISHQDRPTALALTGGVPATPAADGTRAVALDDALAGINGYAAEQGSLRLIQGFLFAVSALVTGAFFTVWTVQRKPDIAVLKAVGAGSGYLVRDALAQAAAVLLLGALLGAAAGVAGGAVAGRAVPFALGPATAAVPVTAMVLLGLAGSALAVRRITSVDPLTALGATR
ncbi:ABC transporter permease [Streptomyces sp. NPDC051940]|uniref:ABC transporter permease n=1 Tax=Streptomyces sp. NPDC051940 TaxID=3155675 RepID=UPI003448A958